jgi:hypothetical protein
MVPENFSVADQNGGPRQFVMLVSRARVISYPFSLSTRVTTAPLEIIYSDVWGPAQTSVSGHQFYVSFVDAYSCFT